MQISLLLLLRGKIIFRLAHMNHFAASVNHSFQGRRESLQAFFLIERDFSFSQSGTLRCGCFFHSRHLTFFLFIKLREYKKSENHRKNFPRCVHHKAIIARKARGWLGSDVNENIDYAFRGARELSFPFDD